MDELKNKMYNYETTPPAGVWEDIAAALDRNEAKIIPIKTRKKDSTIYYVAAASVILIFFCWVFFTNRSSTHEDIQLAANETQHDSSGNNSNDNYIMTVPIEEKSTLKNNTDTVVLPANDRLQKGGPNHKEVKESINNADSSENNLIAANTPRYITIEGPEGQPVKISSKMAMLIDSSETKVASKPIWNKKINEWKEIMKANTLAPTPGNFLDIVELTKSLKDIK